MTLPVRGPSHCYSFAEAAAADQHQSLADEDLARLFKGNPPTEDAYVYRGNGPHNGVAVSIEPVAA